MTSSRADGPGRKHQKHRRQAGVTLSLFSLRSTRDFGIGEIGDLPRFAEWLRDAGFRLVQLLPTFELARGETSPYGARTAFGLDPIYVSLSDVPELDDAAIAAALGSSGAAELEAVRALPNVDYARVRALKDRVLDAALERFVNREIGKGSPRARAFLTFREGARGWLDDLSLYVALRDEKNEHGWSTWPSAERERSPRALDEARARLDRQILAHAYRQFIANEQWAAARKKLADLDVEIMGDLPFIVGSESADVWSHRRAFRTDVSLGAPPDAYSADGQDWGLPAYDFDRLEHDGYAWLKERTRRASELYDRFRIDHVVGYFRQWVKPHGARRGHFDLPAERVQRARGEHVLRELRGVAGDGSIIAEDLGVIPPWVRATLTELAIPGYRILPWERDGDVVRDPTHFPALSVASWSTHDTAPIALWWREMSAGDRKSLATMMGVAEDASSDALFEAHMRTLFQSGSDLVLTLAQEVLGEDRRINLPGTVGPDNWTYRFGASLERLASDTAMSHRLDKLRALLEEAHR
jgi:4-alpha-glucanotransferase